MTRFILTRAFYSLITLWLLVTIVFGFVRLTGDPTTMLEEVGDRAYVAQLGSSGVWIAPTMCNMARCSGQVKTES